MIVRNLNIDYYVLINDYIDFYRKVLKLINGFCIGKVYFFNEIYYKILVIFKNVNND